MRYNDEVFTVVIPTRNRQEILSKLLDYLNDILDSKYEIVIVDSSDKKANFSFRSYNFRLRYITTEIRSAAIQRNLGLDSIDLDTKYVFFLDDDVVPPRDYFEDMIKCLESENAVGISGLALNLTKKERRTYPKGLSGLLHRIFFLDSKHDGRLLLSGVNVPVRNYGGITQEVDWLIACSMWDFSKIDNIRFEHDFHGASVAEDVIFSTKMKKRGKLVTNPKIVIAHLESDVSRASSNDFWKMWITNRYRLIKVADRGLLAYFIFWWSNFGQLLIFIFGLIRGKKQNLQNIKGLIAGVQCLLA